MHTASISIYAFHARSRGYIFHQLTGEISEELIITTFFLAATYMPFSNAKKSRSSMRTSILIKVWECFPQNLAWHLNGNKGKYISAHKKYFLRKQSLNIISHGEKK